jgi:hypothetical protein
MAAARHRAEAAVNELIVHRVLAVEASQIKKPDEEFLRPIAEFFLQNHYFDVDRVIAGLGLDPDKLYESDPIEKAARSGSLADLCRLVWLLMVPDTIDHESDQIKTWAKRNKLDLSKVRKELTARIEKACFYCGCTELTPCEGGCAWIPTGAPITDMHPHICNGAECVKKAEKEWADNGYQAKSQQTPVNQKPLTTEATEKHGGKAKSSTAKDAKAAKVNRKSKPTGKSAGATKTKAKGQGPKAKSQAKPKGKRKA